MDNPNKRFFFSALHRLLQNSLNKLQISLIESLAYLFVSRTGPIAGRMKSYACVMKRRKGKHFQIRFVDYSLLLLYFCQPTCRPCSNSGCIGFGITGN